MYLDPTSKSLICADDFFCEISVRTQKFHAARQPRRNDVGVFQKDFAVCLALQPRDPWLNRPYSIHAAALKQSKLIRVEGACEDPLHGGRAGIVSVPLNRDAGPKRLFKPTFVLPRQRMRDDALRVRNVWEMSQANHRFGFPAAELRQKGQSSNSYNQCFYLHIFRLFQI